MKPTAEQIKAIALIVDGEAWKAIEDGRDALSGSLWGFRRDIAMEKAMAIAALPFLSTLPIAGEGKAPEGWQLVPTVATLEMEHAAVARVKTFHDEDWYRIMPKDLFRLAWKALLGAAPAPPSPTVYANVNDAVLDPTPISPILYTRSSPGKDGGPEVEAVAKRIYEAMRLAAHAHDPERTTPEWVERGNSLMQEEARRIHGKIP